MFARDCPFALTPWQIPHVPGLESWKQKIVMGSSFERYVGIFRRVARTCEGDREGNNELLTQEIVLENSYIRFCISMQTLQALFCTLDTTPREK